LASELELSDRRYINIASENEIPGAMKIRVKNN
jgi:hypothetical protein